MVLVMKLTTFAWNTWDGRRPVEVSTSLTQPLLGLAQRARIYMQDLDKWQTKMRVTKLPSLLEFLGFS